MKLLLVKMSSLGDLLHTFPALTDAQKQIPDLELTWLVEEAFQDLPLLHPIVKKVIPISWRRWRKNKYQAWKTGEIQLFWQRLREESYDGVLDAQGLIKSAIVTRLARGKRIGLDKASAWESLASLAYQKTISVNPNQHAITRVRQLFAGALDYPIELAQFDYGIDWKWQAHLSHEGLIFLHGTTWENKLWPENYWKELARLCKTEKIYLPWGNDEEKARAERIAQDYDHVHILPKMNIMELAQFMQSLKGAVSVDTGLGHLSAALGLPTISLYGPTDPEKTGLRGKNQIHISSKLDCAPCLNRRCQFKGQTTVFPACFKELTPQYVYHDLKQILLEKNNL